MRTTIILVFAFLSVPLFGQQRPAFLPAQLQAFDTPSCCQTGLDNNWKTKIAELSFNILGRGSFEGENNSILSEPYTDIASRQTLFMKFQVPVINKPGFKLVGGYTFQNEQYKIKSIGTEYFDTFQYLDNLNLRSVTFNVQLIKSIKEQSYFTAIFNQGFNGDLQGVFDLKNKYSLFQIAGLYAHKFSARKEVGIGVFYSQDFVDNQWLPILMYNHNFAAQWSIEALLPFSIYLKSYRDERTIVSIGAEYAGSIFNISYQDPSNSFRNYAFDQSAIAGTILIEKQITPWLWFYSKIGFQTNLSSTFAPLNEESSFFEVDQTDTPFFKLSLFISPPESFLK